MICSLVQYDTYSFIYLHAKNVRVMQIYHEIYLRNR